MSGEVVFAVVAPCGSCGEPTKHRIILRWGRIPACLRHTNVWRYPPPDYTCSSLCAEVNHRGQEHNDWLAPTSRPGVESPSVGCCTSCHGRGGAGDGPCWDCRGTGCAHPAPTCHQPESPSVERGQS